MAFSGGKRHLESSTAAPHISEFYNDSVVFLTGGSGFLGKALLIKILRTCYSVHTVYVMMRVKKQQSSEERFAAWLENPVFDGLRRDQPEQLKKLICITGDMSMPQLGISADDLQRLHREVNIVIHAAATVRFDEAVHVAVNLNTLGTQQIMQMCKEMKKLKSVVHVSTAYSNPGMSFVEEKVYAPVPRPERPSMLWLLGIERDKRKVQGDHPNTYTLTKAMAENIVRDYHDHFGLPVCIVRPSIIGCAITEPEPYWTEGLHGTSGFIMELHRGTLQCINIDPESNIDIIPVDYVCNLILSAAWYNVHHKTTPEINIFHSASGQTNPYKWGKASALVIDCARRNPSKYCLWYPHIFVARNRILYNICDLTMHYFPAFCFDFYNRLKGIPPQMTKLWKKRAGALRTMEYFSNRNWIFDTTNTARLQKAVDAAADGRKFPFDVRNIDWTSFTEGSCVATRRYVFKEDINCVKHVSRLHKKFETIKMAYVAVRVLLVAVILIVFFNLMF